MSLANFLEGSGRLPFVQNEYRIRDLKVTQMEAPLLGAPIQLRGVGIGGNGTQQILGINRIDCNEIEVGLILDGSGNETIDLSGGDLILRGGLDVSGSLVIGSNIQMPQLNTILSGAGVPALATTAGSIYLRSDGASANEVLYVNHDGLIGSWLPLTT